MKNDGLIFFFVVFKKTSNFIYFDSFLHVYKVSALKFCYEITSNCMKLSFSRLFNMEASKRKKVSSSHNVSSQKQKKYINFLVF